MRTLTFVASLIVTLVIFNIPDSIEQREGVVRVYVYNDDDNRIDTYGSGTVISSTQVLTNWHVIEKGRDNLPVRIRFSDGTRCVAKIIHKDETWDMALLEFDRTDKCQPIEIGERPLSRTLATIHGFGFDYEYKAQTGTVSNVFYYPTGLTTNDADFFAVRNVLARGGDSGGPVTDMQGKLIGVLNRKDIIGHSTRGITIDRIKKIFGSKFKKDNDD